MKKVVFFLIVMGCLFMGCQKNELETELEKSDVRFSFDIENELSLRSISDGSSITQLVYAVFDENGDIIYDKQVVDNFSAYLSDPYSMTIPLVRGEKYQVVFWAQSEECTAYDVSDDMKITINYDGVNNDEKRDAFFATTGVFEVKGTTSIAVTLKRPFAQVNIGTYTYDSQWASEQGFDVALSSAQIKGVPNVINLLDGSVDGVVDVNYQLSAIPNEDLYVDIDEDGEDESFEYLSMSYILAGSETSVHDMTFTFADATAANQYTVSNGLEAIPVQRNKRTNIVGQILTGTIGFEIKIDPIYDGEIINGGGVYYNFTEDTYIKNKEFAFNTYEEAIFTSENNNLLTFDDVTFSGNVQCIAFGAYVKINNEVLVNFTNELNNVVAKDMVVTHSKGIANVEPIDYMAPLIFLRGVSTVTNCTFTGTTTIAPDRKDYNGNYHEVIAYDCGVPNDCEATFDNCTVDKLYAWSHSMVTLKNTKMKYIRCSTHNNSKHSAHLTIDAGSVVDEIVVTSTGLAKFVRIDGKKTLTADPWAPSLIIKSGATVKRLDMNGRPTINNRGEQSVIIEEGAIVEEIVNAAI